MLTRPGAAKKEITEIMQCYMIRSVAVSWIQKHLRCVGNHEFTTELFPLVGHLFKATIIFPTKIKNSQARLKPNNCACQGTGTCIPSTIVKKINLSSEYPFLEIKMKS